MRQYVVVPRKSEDDIEKYEEGSTNVVEFKALDYQGNYIHNMAELHIVFGADAVEGLGNELLRCYISGEKINGIHLQSSYENYIFEGMGICVSPKSPDIVFMEKDLDINDLIKKTIEIQEALHKLFDVTKILGNEKYDLKNFIINEKILYCRLELLSYSVLNYQMINVKYSINPLIILRSLK